MISACLSEPGQHVGDLLASGIPVSLALGGLSMALALLIGVPFGTLAAARHNRPFADHLSMGLMLALSSIPIFLLIIPLIDFFSIKCGWLPSGQWGDSGWLGIKEMILPVLVNALVPASFFARSLRSMLLESLGQPYIRTARAKGVGMRRILWTHALKNAVPSFASVLGPALATIVSGSFFVETTFSINGIAAITVRSTMNGDLTVTEATTLLLATAVVVANAATDIVQAMLDPRVRLQ